MGPMLRVESEVEDFRDAVRQRLDAPGPSRGAEAAAVLVYIPLWLQHFWATARSSCALELLSGAQAATLESVACIDVGFARAAIVAMRLEVELIIGYTYFRDHSVEWDRVAATGDGFMLLGALDKYHREANSRVQSRLAALEARSEYPLKRVRRLLSAHVHGQSRLTLPTASSLSSLVATEYVQDQLVDLQRKVDEALSDYLVAVYAESWMELPPKAIAHASSSMTPEKRREFFESKL